MRSAPAAKALADDRGSVTAEFAIVLPAVVAVLGLVIGGVLIAAHRIGLVSTAAEVARLEARGDSGAARDRLSALAEHVSVSRDRRGVMHCVTLASHPGGGALSAIAITAEGCAAVSGSGP